MSFNRTQSLINAIEFRLHMLKVTGIDPDRILELLNKVEFKLCKDYFALKSMIQMVLEGGKDNYSLSGKFHKISSIVVPINWSVNELTVFVDSSSWSEYISDHPTLSGNPVALFVWDKVAYFYPEPCRTGDELKIYFYALSSKKIALDTAPEINDDWDEALEWGVVSEIVPDASDKFKSIATDMMQSNINETTKGVLKRRHTSDEIGF